MQHTQLSMLYLYFSSFFFFVSMLFKKLFCELAFTVYIEQNILSASKFPFHQTQNYAAFLCFFFTHFPSLSLSLQHWVKTKKRRDKFKLNFTLNSVFIIFFLLFFTSSVSCAFKRNLFHIWFQYWKYWKWGKKGGGKLIMVRCILFVFEWECFLLEQ